MLDIFNSTGGIRDLDPSEVEALPDNQRDVLLKCLAAVRAAEDAEAHVNATRAKVRSLMQAESEAMIANDAANAPLTHHENMLAVSAAQRPGYKPAPRKVNKKTRDALAAVVAELAAERATLLKAEAAQKSARTAQGVAVLAWSATQPKVTAFDNIRNHIAAGQQRLVDEKAGLIEPPKVEERVHLSPIDQTFASRPRAVRH